MSPRYKDDMVSRTLPIFSSTKLVRALEIPLKCEGYINTIMPVSF